MKTQQASSALDKVADNHALRPSAMSAVREAVSHLREAGKAGVRTLIAQPALRRTIKKLHRAIDWNDEETTFNRIDETRLFRNLRHREADLRPSRFQGKRTFLLTDRTCSPELERKLGPVIRTLDGMSTTEIASSVFYVYFLCDSDALPSLKRIRECGGVYVPHFDPTKTSYRFVNRAAYEAMRKTWAKHERVSHLNAIIHENICEALWVTRELEGDYVEIGVYLGGSALTAINMLDEISRAGAGCPSRTAWLLDTYDGFSYPEAFSSSDAMWAGTHSLFGVEKTMRHIDETLSGTATPRRLIACNICSDPLPTGISKIAVANIDVDMYEPTLTALTMISDLVVPGGIIICEDPASTPALYGAYLAMDEFVASKQGRDYVKLFKGGQYFLIRRN
jgi:hypothetical protein